jgi:PRC-barrel domain
MSMHSLALASAITALSFAGQPAAAQTPATPEAAAPQATPGSTTGSNSAAVPVTGPTGSVTRQFTVEAVEAMDLLAATGGDEIGDIEGVFEKNADKKQFVLVERGGFLGFGAKEIAVPLENMAVQNDKLVLRNMDVAQLDAMPEFDNRNNAFRDLDDGQQVNLPVHQ